MYYIAAYISILLRQRPPAGHLVMWKGGGGHDTINEYFAG